MSQIRSKRVGAVYNNRYISNSGAERIKIRIMSQIRRKSVYAVYKRGT